MRKILPLMCLMALTFTAPQAWAYDNDVTEEVAGLASFENIISDCSFDVKFRQGDVQQVMIKGDNNRDLSAIKVTVKDNTLYVENNSSFNMLSDAELLVTAPMLYSVTTRSSGDIDIRHLNTTHFTATIAGKGDIELNGTSDTATYENNGSGTIDAENFRVKEVTATVNSRGDIDCYCNDTLNATVKGRGEIEYSGKPLTVNRAGRTSAIHSER